ncbi:ArnT family glycosyltransferase [Desulfobacter curvatus]|uniref:ArnT family glycosyltransferase n=1 Tax=Desulfobacter curvatus TaxID=2290 RepID=UPI0012FB756D|nr:glycosyltransferase family 39 protein [Desulfobacter curvatus]
MKVHLFIWIYLAIFIFLLSLLWMLCLVPPVSRDALVHHLAVPKIYLNHGRIIELPCMRFSYYPMNLDLLYWGALYLGSDILPKFIHCSFGIATVGCVFYYLKTRLNIHFAVYGALLLMIVPIFIRLSITAYVDLGLMFFSFAALLGVIKWDETNQMRYLVLGALCCGLAMGTKYNGLITFVFLALGVLFLASRKVPQIKALMLFTSFVLISLTVFSPWMIRNMVWTGNPVYPLYNGLFDSEHQKQCEVASYALSDHRLKINKFLYRKNVYQEDTLDLLMLPLRYFFQGKDHDPRYFDGKLSIALLIFPFFSLLKTNHKQAVRSEKWFIVYFTVLFFLSAFFGGPLRVRYVVPILPCLVILSVYGLDNMLRFIRNNRIRISSWSFACIILFGMSHSLISSFKYIVQTIENISPVQYIRGDISREDYITHFRPEYSTFEYINNNLPEDTKILFFFLGGRGYYCDRQYIPDQDLNLFKIYELIRVEEKLDDVAEWFRKKGITHFVFNYKIVQERIENDLSQSEKLRLYTFLDMYTSKEFGKNGFGVHSICFNFYRK